MGATKKTLLAGSSLLAMTLGLGCHDEARADVTISSSGAVSQSWMSGNFTITNNGTISGVSRPISSSGTLGTLTNSGVLSATRTGVYNTGSIAAVTNSGAIGGTLGGINNNAGIGSISNSGTIRGDNSGLSNRGSIASLSISNTGAIIGSGYYGIANGSGASIGTLTIDGSISGRSAISNSGAITSLSNSGHISGHNSGLGIANSGHIGTLSNSGTIQGGVTTAIGNTGSIGTLSNSGLISDVKWGVYNGTVGSTISVLHNISGGTIHGGNTAVLNVGAISALTNDGLISGNTYALKNNVGASIGQITNTGVIAGNILNSSSHALSIAGASDGSYGLLTGYNAGSPSLVSPGTVGSIDSTSANLLFTGGKLLLNDNINVGSGTVSNSGTTLKIQSALSITGRYNQSGGGLVVLATGNGLSYGYMTVSSNATVSGATITISGSGLSAGESFSIVRSGGTGSYDNDTALVSGTSGLKANVTTVSNNLVVTLVTAKTYTQLGDSAGGAANGVGVALDAIRSSSSATAVAFQNSVLNVLDVLPESQQPSAIKQLAPTQLQPALLVQTQAVTPTATAIEQRQLSIERTGEVGMAAGSSGHDSAVWGQVISGGANRGSTVDADGYRSQNFGLVGGFDHQVTTDMAVGVAASWLRGWSWGSGGSSGSWTKSDTYQLVGYGLQHWGQLFADGQLAIGNTSYRQKRAVNFLGQEAEASYDGMLYQGKVGVGYDVPLDGMTLTPLAGLRLLRMDTDGYTETGAGSANLTVDRKVVESLTQDVGGKVSWSTDTQWGRLTPEVGLAWVHDYRNGPIASSGLMGGAAFTSSVSRPAADGARINLAATLDRSDDLTLRAELEGEFRNKYQSGNALLKINWDF